MQLVTAITRFMVAGGFGALVNCALANYFSTQVDILHEIFLHPVAAAGFLKTLLCGFFGGTLLLLVWQFLKVRMVRHLFQRNSWFLRPKNPANKVSRCVVYTPSSSSLNSTLSLALLFLKRHFFASCALRPPLSPLRYGYCW